MLRKGNQTVTGKKTINDLHLSDVFLDRETESEERTNILPHPQNSTKSPEEIRIGFEKQASIIETQVIQLRNLVAILESLKESLPEIRDEITPRGGHFCRGLFRSLERIYKSNIETPHIAIPDNEIRICNGTMALFKKYSSRPTILTGIAGVKEGIENAIVELDKFGKMLSQKMEAVLNLLTTTSPPELAKLENKIRLKNFERMKLKAIELTEELETLSSHNYQQYHWLSMENMDKSQMSNMNLGIQSRITDGNRARISLIEEELADLQEEIGRLKPEVYGIPSGKRGSGSLVIGKVAGQNLYELSRMLDSMTPSELEQIQFLSKAIDIQIKYPLFQVTWLMLLKVQ